MTSRGMSFLASDIDRQGGEQIKFIDRGASYAKTAVRMANEASINSLGQGEKSHGTNGRA